ncbi:hypothetical protein CLU79DRAFT_497921 [Phycomyces nitens]|nr:hypothetical protein CLU79DRAFT_497921 [Phycomyces nitens]
MYKYRVLYALGLASSFFPPRRALLPPFLSQSTAMEMNICLYCEKRLDDDNLSFCSGACEENEASKSTFTHHNYRPTSERHCPTPSLNLSYKRRFMYNSLGKKSNRCSLSMHTPFLASSSSSSSSTDSVLSVCSCDDKHDSPFLVYPSYAGSMDNVDNLFLAS